jgi:hypothetical protein
MKFSYTQHKGMAPKIAEHLLPSGNAVIAQNCKTYSGELRPLLNNKYVDELGSGSQVVTIYYYLGQYWFEFTDEVDIQQGPVQNDLENRIYWTGSGIPKKTNEDEATTGSAPYPANFYPIGVPTPDYAITATPGGGGSGDARDVAYEWTIVTAWGEEGLPSDPSNIVSALQGQTVDLTGMSMTWTLGTAYTARHSWVFPVIDTGYVYRCVTSGTSGASEPDWNNAVDQDTTDNTVVWRSYKKEILAEGLAEKRIYRANSGETGAVWSLVDTIAINIEGYSDSTTDDNLEQTILPSENWDPPPDNLSGLVAVGQSMAGFVGKDIYMCEPNRPHAWPYSLSVAHSIVGLAAVGNALVVMTERNPVIFVGSHPDSMSPKVLSQPKKCLSKAGIVNFPKGVLYPSAEGLEWINGTDIDNLTKDLFTKIEWSDYYPDTMKSVYHESKYYGFYSSGDNEGAIVIDTESGEVATLDFYTEAIYVDPENDTLYYINQDTEILLLEGGTPSPSRANSILLENGDKILME